MWRTIKKFCLRFYVRDIGVKIRNEYINRIVTWQLKIGRWQTFNAFTEIFNFFFFFFKVGISKDDAFDEEQGVDKIFQSYRILYLRQPVYQPAFDRIYRTCALSSFHVPFWEYRFWNVCSRKVLKKIHSEQSVSEYEVWFELSRPLHHSRPTKQSSWNSSWYLERNCSAYKS